MLISCNGMIRSGSTLQYNLVKGIVEHAALGVGQGFLPQHDLPLLEKQIFDWASHDDLHVVKTHVMLPYTENMLSKGDIKVCYIYRDIRDVAVSVKLKFKRADKELLEILDNAISLYYKILSLDNVVVQKYEDVSSDLLGAASLLASQLGLNVSHTDLVEISQDCSISSAKKKLETIKSHSQFRAAIVSFLRKAGLAKIVKKLLPHFPFLSSFSQAYDRSTLLHPSHISKNSGASGLWRTQLSTDEAEMLTKRYERWLKETGYIS